MKRITENGLPLLGFEPVDGFLRVSTTRHGGESTGDYKSLNLGLHVGDDPGVVRRNRKALAAAIGATPDALTFGRQVHGSTVAVIDTADAGSGSHDAGAAIDDADAMITDAPNVPLVILVADCVVVTLVDPVKRAAGIAHAGWRGTVAGIAAKTVARMREVYGSDPADLVAGIGPSIGPCCYEVGEEVVADVYGALPGAAADVITRPDGPRARLDLWAANRILLERTGVAAERIEVAGMCTACNTDTFYSHRAERGATGRFAGVVMLRDAG